MKADCEGISVGRDVEGGIRRHRNRKCRGNSQGCASSLLKSIFLKTIFRRNIPMRGKDEGKRKKGELPGHPLTC